MTTRIDFFKQPDIPRDLGHIDDVFRTALAQHAVGQLVEPQVIHLLSRNDAIESRIGYSKDGNNAFAEYILTCRGLFNVISELGNTWWLATVSVRLNAKGEMQVGPTSDEWTPVSVYIYDTDKRVWSEKISYLHAYCREDESGMSFETNDSLQGWPDPYEQPFEEFRRSKPKAKH